MTVGQLLTKVLLIPALVAIFAYPTYLYVVEGVDPYSTYSVLQMFTVTVSTTLLLAVLGIIVCYTICNWQEDIKTFLNYNNLKFYLEKGRPNSYNQFN